MVFGEYAQEREYRDLGLKQANPEMLCGPSVAFGGRAAPFGKPAT
jgi:hypothetical protein